MGSGVIYISGWRDALHPGLFGLYRADVNARAFVENGETFVVIEGRDTRGKPSEIVLHLPIIIMLYEDLIEIGVSSYKYIYKRCLVERKKRE